MLQENATVLEWAKNVIKQDEIDRYLVDGKDFVDDELIAKLLADQSEPDPAQVRELANAATSGETLTPEQTATLMRVKDEGLWEEMYAAAARAKRAIYDNRVVTFAPLYCGDLCVNDCAYCGFRKSNEAINRKVLSYAAVEREAALLAGKFGHKRLVIVFGEHPSTDADYIAECMRRIYSVKVPTRCGEGAIRRVNVNAAPMEISELAKLHEAGIGTFQVFQETYHRNIYSEVHPANTVKGNFRWRLYALHRAMDAGIDDVAMGALLGLADWRFELLAMVMHTRDLEKRFGIGVHTVSVPRIEPAENTEFSWLKHRLTDQDFKHIVCLLRLSIPSAGLIVTCRENPQMIRDVIPMCTQRDASSRIGIGAYADGEKEDRGEQTGERQQFILGDTRSLDEVIRELASMGYITSFCTAGYRCGRTGKKIMGLLKSGQEGCFCKLNAVLTFQEWLEDFATPETQAIGNQIVAKELAEIATRSPSVYPEPLYKNFLASLELIKRGKRDIFF
jgi:2-iminoacetate synthase